MRDFQLIEFTGENINVLRKIRKEYEKCVTLENAKIMLYLRLNKILYGCIPRGILLYETFTELLCNMRFKINPNDPCVANKTVNGKQCTIIWYVDDLKSHM